MREAVREAVIVSSARTPLAKSHRGSFNITRPDDLAAHCIVEALKKVPALDPATIEEVILGCGQPHGPQGHNVARVAALRRSEEHTSELQSQSNLVCRLLLEKKNKKTK